MTGPKFCRELQKQTGPKRRKSQLKDRLFEIVQLEEQREKGMKRNKESLWVLGTPLRELIYRSEDSQKKKRGRKEQKAYF